MPRSIVIGGNGFLGSHLVDLLASLGHEVTVFDRFSAGKVNFEASEVTRVTADFGDHAALSKAVSGQDLVFHFLAGSSPFSSISEGLTPMISSLRDHQVLIDVCIESKVRHFYFASSGGSIYGDQGLDRYSEKDRCEPASPYAIEKATVEHMLRYAEKTSGLSSTSLRISNPYGPRQKVKMGQGLIATALNAARSGIPVIQMGDGSMVRDYIYVTDLMKMIGCLVSLQSTDLPVVNLGSGVGTTVAEVLAAVEKATVKLELQIVDAPPGTVQRVVLDTGLYHSVTENSVFEFVSVSEGIRLMLTNGDWN